MPEFPLPLDAPPVPPPEPEPAPIMAAIVCPYCMMQGIRMAFATPEEFHEHLIERHGIVPNLTAGEIQAIERTEDKQLP